MTAELEVRSSRPRRSLTDGTVRAALITPVLVLAASVSVDGIAPLGRWAGLAVLIGLLVLATVAPPRLTAPGAVSSPGSVAFVGTAVVVAALVLVTEDGLDPTRHTLVFGVIAVAAAFSLPDHQRRPLVWWAVIAWAVTLVATGVRDPAVLATQLGGAALLAVVALTTSRTLEVALEVERGAAAEAATRNALLTTVLRMRSLDAGEVLQAVVRGTATAGFDTVALWVRAGDRFRLTGARPAAGQHPPLWHDGAAAADLVATVVRSGAACLREDLAADPAALPWARGLHGAIAAPLLVGSEVAAVLVAARGAHGTGATHREAVQLLAEEGGAALARARSFADDAATVGELQRLDERTHDFVSMVSHELRTPMTVLTGLGRTLDRRWEELSDERRTDLLRRIDANARRLAAMVSSLIDTSAHDEGRLVAERAEVAPAQLVTEVLGRLEPLLAGHIVSVEAADSVPVVADPDLVAHVLENLLGNAARHTPAGTHVEVVVRRVEDEVEVVVADDGPGIPEADLPHVLERFYRGGTPETRAAGGLGLGLALARQIVAAHGSDLAVTSRPGEGTRFSFRLPTTDGRAGGPADRR